MGKISRGAPAKGSPPRGSWGDRYVIENTYSDKRVSCANCINYCAEDKSCTAKPIFVPLNGYTYWIKCDRFVLSPEFSSDLNLVEIVNQFKNIENITTCTEKSKPDKSETEIKIAFDRRKAYKTATQCPYFNKIDNHCQKNKGSSYCRLLRGIDCSNIR